MDNPFVHNISLASHLSKDGDQYVHLMSFLVSDIDMEKNEPVRTHTLAMNIAPAAPAETFAAFLRALADRVEAVSKTATAEEVEQMNEDRSSAVG